MKDPKEEEVKSAAIQSIFSNAKEVRTTARAYYFAYSLYELLCRLNNNEGIMVMRQTIWNRGIMQRELNYLKELIVEAKERTQLIEDLSKEEMRYAERVYSSSVRFTALSRKKKLSGDNPLGVAGAVSKAGELSEREKVIYIGSILQRSLKLANRVALFTNQKPLHPFCENLAIELGQHYWACALTALEDD